MIIRFIEKFHFLPFWYICFMTEIQYELQLKNAIELSFGSKITHSHQCEALAKNIDNICGITIGANTLRRFLGFLYSPYKSSKKTLDILSLYSGYEDWSSFKENLLLHAFHPMSIDEEGKFYLEFYKIKVTPEADLNYHNACRNIAHRILFNPALLQKLSPKLARNPTAHIYFFERFPYIDGLGGKYKNCVKQYLQKKDKEAQIFGNALLCLSSFLTGKHTLDLKSYNVLSSISLSEEMHPFTVARHLGTRILHSFMINAHLTDEHKIEIEKWGKFFLTTQKTTHWYYPYFQHMMAEYLNLLGCYSEANQILNSTKYFSAGYSIEKGYVEAMQISFQISTHLSSPKKFLDWFKLNKSFDVVNPLFKNYYDLQALCAFRNIVVSRKKREQCEKRIEELVNKTGFEYFRDFSCQN